MGVVSSLVGGQFSASHDNLANEFLARAAEKAAKKAAQEMRQNIPMTELQGNFFSALRPYFEVDGRYIQHKMKRILCPFAFKEWTRTVCRRESGICPIETNIRSHHCSFNRQSRYVTSLPENRSFPASNENTPDLYIPCMSFFTYILLCAVGQGASGQFSPDIILTVFQKCLLALFLEVMVLLLCFRCGMAGCSVLDLVSCAGYKYVSLCINVVVGSLAAALMDGNNITSVQRLSFLYTCATASYFMVKVWLGAMPEYVLPRGPKDDMTLLVVAASQPLFMWYIARSCE